MGTGTIAVTRRKFLSFTKARKFVHALNLTGQRQWNKYCKGEMLDLGLLPINIPSNPAQSYNNKGWISFGDWFGTGTVATYLRKYRSYKNARQFARSLKLRGQKDWYAYCAGNIPGIQKLPGDIPASPHWFYAKKGWISYGDWLGTNHISSSLRKFRSFTDARKYVRELKLKNSEDWNKFKSGKLLSKGKLPLDIPACPSQTYENKGWIGMIDWLGTKNFSRINCRSFTEARLFVRKLKLKNRDEWFKYCRGELTSLGKIPIDIPLHPYSTFEKAGWSGWSDWLGNGRKPRIDSPKN